VCAAIEVFIYTFPKKGRYVSVKARKPDVRRWLVIECVRNSSNSKEEIAIGLYIDRGSRFLLYLLP
jgi:hypothetical protein